MVTLALSSSPTDHGRQAVVGSFQAADLFRGVSGAGRIVDLTVDLPVLQRFGEADAELLAARALLRRVDSKFLVAVSSLDEILGKVTGDYGIVLAGGNRTATYRTIYYDTPQLRCFHDHRRGRRPRQKVRIRHYDDRDVSYLEIKTKRSEFISAKKRRRQAYSDSVLDADGRVFVDENSRLPAEALVPTVHTDFRRITLVGFSVHERITLDVDLVVRRDGDDDDDSERLDGVSILEVKQARFTAHSPIMRALRESGYRPTSASKYCTATALLTPNLRLNRLLPSLRAVERLRSWAT